jgi:xylulokinase
VTAAGEVTVGIDIGTTSTKAVAVDGEGRVKARARVPHPLVVTAPDRMEHQPNRAWRRGPTRALSALGPLRSRGVCVAAVVPSLTAVDRRGLARTPGLLYGDVRGRTPLTDAGSMLSGELEALLAWTSAHAPSAMGYWPAQALAGHALGGEAVIDAATAQASYPLFNGRQWDEARVLSAGARLDQLPRVSGTGVACGRVGDAVLCAGAVDAMAEQLVAGAHQPGDVLVICGTTLVTWVVVDAWKEAPGLWTVPHTVPGLFLVGGPSVAGGLFLSWVRRMLGRAKRSPEPSRVPVWAPYPRGERTPLHDPHRRAQLSDLDLTHDAAAVLRAAHEASGFVVRHHVDLAGVVPRRLVATGGGVNSPAWVQALADCTELPVDVVAVPEGGALGAAFLARLAAGLETSVYDAARWARTGHRVEPDQRWAGPARDRYLKFRALSDEGGGGDRS